MQSHHTHLGGQSFHYLTWGDPGLPVLVLLHGFPEFSGAWDEVATRLCHRFHCIAPDQRGYGQSWAPPDVGHYTTRALVGDMAELITQVAGTDAKGRPQPVTVMGHDWGAAVAYGLAMMQPDLVNRLIIANGVHPAPFQTALAAGGAQTDASQYIHFLRAAGSEELLAADGFHGLVRLFSAHMDLSWLSGDLLRRYKAEWARPGRLRGMVNWYRASPLRLGQAGERLTDLPDLPRARLLVPQPHLLIWGEDDTALLPEATEGLETYAPDLTRVQISGADHWLCHQCPDAVAGAVLDWLGQA